MFLYDCSLLLQGVNAKNVMTADEAHRTNGMGNISRKSSLLWGGGALLISFHLQSWHHRTSGQFLLAVASLSVSPGALFIVRIV